MTVIDTANRRCFPAWSTLAKWEEKQDVGLPNAVQQNAFQMQIPDPEFQRPSPKPFSYTHIKHHFLVTVPMS